MSQRHDPEIQYRPQRAEYSRIAHVHLVEKREKLCKKCGAKYKGVPNQGQCDSCRKGGSR